MILILVYQKKFDYFSNTDHQKLRHVENSRLEVTEYD